VAVVHRKWRHDKAVGVNSVGQHIKQIYLTKWNIKLDLGSVMSMPWLGRQSIVCMKWVHRTMTILVLYTVSLICLCLPQVCTNFEPYFLRIRVSFGNFMTLYQLLTYNVQWDMGMWLWKINREEVKQQQLWASWGADSSWQDWEKSRKPEEISQVSEDPRDMWNDITRCQPLPKEASQVSENP